MGIATSSTLALENLHDLLDVACPASEEKKLRYDIDGAIEALMAETRDSAVEEQAEVLLAAFSGKLTWWRGDEPNWDGGR